MCNGIGKHKVTRVTTYEEAAAAIREAKELPDHFIVLEAVVSPNDAAASEGVCP